MCAAAAGCARGGGVEDAPDVPEPQAGVDVVDVTMTLRVDPTAFTLSGQAALRVAHPADLGTLRLGLDDAMQVESVRVDGRAVEPGREANALSVPVSGDSSTVEVVYAGTPEAGVYREETASGGTVVWTDGWPTRTAGWMPGVHHPGDPVVLDLTLEVPSAWEIVASGTPEAETLVDGWRRARFVTAEDAPLYTLAWAAGDFAVTEQAGSVPIRHLTLAGDSASVVFLDRTPAILDTLVGLLGPLPYGRYATVEVPLVYAGMENAAAPFFQIDLYNEASGALEEVNIHEAVHQWWGNDVVPADWRHLWLAEGPATYLTAVVYERLDGQEAFREQLVRMSLLSRRDATRPLVPNALSAPEAALTATVYQKGGAFLHILRRTVGDASFFDGLRATLAAYDDAPLATAAFQSELETASGADLDALFDYWAYGDRIPVLETEWDRRSGVLTWDFDPTSGLRGIGLELYLLQDGASGVYVPLDAGRAELAGDGRPEVYPVGWLAEVEG
ncbi:MAG: M1 family aminopeptidase [Bacteroidota bacterium]